DLAEGDATRARHLQPPVVGHPRTVATSRRGYRQVDSASRKNPAVPGNKGGTNVVHQRTRRTRGWTRVGAVLASSAILAATLVASGVSPAAAQKSGGDLRFGLEAETTGGFCLNQAQLVVAGIQVAAAIYDTLTAPNTKGEYVPNLAESV